MDRKIFESMLEDINKISKINDDEFLGFGDLGYLPERFSVENFHSISGSKEKKSKMVFIDGGNSELFSSPGMCASFVRVFHTIYENNKRISCAADEFYVLCYAKNKDGRIFYHAKLYKEHAKMLGERFFDMDFTFDSLDKDLIEGNSRASISKIPSLVRRIAELHVASAIIPGLCKDDILVLDGDMESRTSEESNAIGGLKSQAQSSGVIACALSKTSNLLASSGSSAVAVLNKFAPSGAWYYFPAASIDGLHVCFAKFNPKSSYVFKCETFNNIDTELLDMIFSLLALNSTDPVFIGYPYGLVEADMLARVSNKESDFLKTSFMALSGKEGSIIESLCKATDAHSILDNMKY
jgi:hypothetical protein